MRLGTTVLGATIGAAAGLGKGETLKYALYGGAIGFVAQLLGVQAQSTIIVGEDREEQRRREERDHRGGRGDEHRHYDEHRRFDHHPYPYAHRGMPGGGMYAQQGQGGGCQCWANVDVFGNIQDHQTCYPTHQDAAQKTNGFPGTPSDTQGGDHPSWVPCPQMSGQMQQQQM